MGQRLVQLGLALTLALAAPACGSSTCGGQARTNDDNAPLVESFFVLSQEQQIPGDPWTVLFGVDFVDENGDLAFGSNPDGDSVAGRAEFYLNSASKPASQDLDAVFRQSGLATNATEGGFWVSLRFDSTTVSDGTKVSLGMQLVDAAGLRSNCFTLDLEFDVSPVVSNRRTMPTWRVASRQCGKPGGQS